LITTPHPDTSGRFIRDHHPRHRRRIRGHVEHVIAMLKNWQNLRQRRRAATPSTTAV
jgi:hypothetical protein